MIIPLMSFPNRLTVNGEELVVHGFSSGSIGRASEADSHKTAEAGNVRYRSWWAAIKLGF